MEGKQVIQKSFRQGKKLTTFRAFKSGRVQIVVTDEWGGSVTNLSAAEMKQIHELQGRLKKEWK